MHEAVQNLPTPLDEHAVEGLLQALPSAGATPNLVLSRTRKTIEKAALEIRLDRFIDDMVDPEELEFPEERAKQAKDLAFATRLRDILRAYAFRLTHLEVTAERQRTFGGSYEDYDLQGSDFHRFGDEDLEYEIEKLRNMQTTYANRRAVEIMFIEADFRLASDLYALRRAYDLGDLSPRS